MSALNNTTDFFSWSIKFMKSLTYPQKFILSGMLFFLIIISPMFELVKSVIEDVAFSDKEKSGVAYIQPLENLLEQLSTGQEIDSPLWVSVESANQALGTKLGVSEDFNGLKTSVDLYNHATTKENNFAVVDKAIGLIEKIGSNSNLLLDPDLDSYALMDTTVLHLPRFSDAVNKATLLLSHYEKAGQFTEAERAALIEYKTMLAYRLGLTKADMDTALASTKSTVLKADLEKPYQAFYETAQSFISTMDWALKGETIAVGTSQSLRQKLNASTFILFKKELLALDHLLKVRIEGITPKLYRASFIAIALLLLNVYLMIGFYKSVTESINSLASVSQAMADGDLTVKLNLDTKDELKILNTSFNTINESFNKVVRNLNQNSDKLLSSSSSLLSASGQMIQASTSLNGLSQSANSVSQDVGANISTLASAIQESTVNINEVYSASEQVANSNERAGQAVKDITVNIQNISKGTEEMSTTVITISNAVEEMFVSLSEVSKNAGQAAEVANRAEITASSSRDSVNTLGRSVAEISQVIDVIKNIAAQTNLLALNASIEAASAGEAGRGFAVVANEVKELAKQCAEATDTIRERIQDIESSSQVAIGSITEIAEVIEELNTINQSIAGAVEEQTSTVNEIGRSLNDLSASASEISTSTQFTALKANDASEQVEQAIGNVKQITRSLEELTFAAEEIAKSAAHAADGASKISESIQRVGTSADETHHEATSVEETATGLAQVAEDVKKMVGSFRV